MSFNSSLYPYDTVVHITDLIGGQSWQGSGVLISPDEVLTATHVVYNSTYGTASDIQVAPAYNYGTEPFGATTGTYIHYFTIQDANGLISKQQSQFDYAVIHLAQPFSNLGTMGLESNFRGGYVNVTGYPAVLNGGMENDPQYVTVDPAYSLLDGTAIGEGSSGGPVWISGNGGGSYVVGLVSSAAGGIGYFTQITTSVFDQIEAWVTRDDGPPPPPPVKAPYYVGGNGATGPALSLKASNSAVVERANSRVALTGSNDAVTMGAHSNLSVYGSNDRIVATTGDGIWINSGTGEAITGAGFTVHGGARTGFTVGGNSLAGANDVVYGSSASVALKASSHMTLTGSNDAVTMGAHSNLTVYGSNDRVAATTGDGIWVNSGKGDTITGSGFTVHGGSGAGLTIKGTADVVYAGLNDAITDSGSHTLFKINSNVGKLSISHFDPTGIIDLLNGAGGYRSASQAFATLTNDGHSGSLLSLGSKGSIDLVGEARSSLHASNFKIG
jgi:V8-like Glu-specific endopeptidase